MRIVLADDAVLLREGLVRLLTEQGHDVVAVVGDGASLVAADAAISPTWWPSCWYDGAPRIRCRR